MGEVLDVYGPVGVEEILVSLAQGNRSAIYLYVDDADALYQEWLQAEVDGRLVEPSDTSYGLREGACLDRDANLIRFGSAIANVDSGS